MIPPIFDKKTVSIFRHKIEQWYRENQRNFFWRRRKLAPYETLVLELMLQKTRAEKVEEIFPVFISKYPSPRSLLAVSLEELEKDLLPLGLNRRRAALLKRIASLLCSKFNGSVPNDYDSLRELPGIGQYIAAAVLCFGFGEKIMPVDVNVKRLLERVFGIEIKNVRVLDKHIQDFFGDMVTAKNDGKSFIWAILDLAALVCKKRNPRHAVCPLKDICKYYSSDRM